MKLVRRISGLLRFLAGSNISKKCYRRGQILAIFCALLAFAPANITSLLVGPPRSQMYCVANRAKVRKCS
jgi:hypothetical protein